jgi:ankyrin repeat protein
MSTGRGMLAPASLQLESSMPLLLLMSLLLAGGIAWAATPAQPQVDAQQVRVQLQRYYFDAARRGDVAMLEEFIAAGYDLDSADGQGYTALILAAYHGHAGLVRRLLAAGADPCAQDRRGNTALMGAIFKGELAIARRLLGARCNPDQRNRAGQTAAMYAALFQRRELLTALAERGADLQAADALGNTAARLIEGEIRGRSSH